MRKYGLKAARLGLLSFPLVLLIVGAFITAKSSSNAQFAQKTDLPEIKNETEAFQIESVVMQDDGFLLLRLKNISTKAITAYSVSRGHIHKSSTSPNKDYRVSGRTDTDYAMSGSVIAPGAIDEAEISLTGLTTSVNGSDIEPVVSIAAAVFEDGSSEGDFEVCKTIKETRLGKRIQFERINPLIQNTLKSSDANLYSALAKLKSDIAALSETSEGRLSRDAEYGLHNAKEDALHLIEQMQSINQARNLNTIVDLRKGLQETVLRQNETWIATYRGKATK